MTVVTDSTVGERQAEVVTDQRGISRWVTADRVVLLVAVVTWLASLPAISSAKVSEWGLVYAAGPGFIVATLLVAVAFAISIRRSALGNAGAALVAFVLVTRATASIAASLPIFSWTFKHIGVVDHIRATGSLARGADIYNAWPGLFAATAWFSQLTGASPVTLARWFPIFADLAIVVGMYSVSRAFRQSKETALVAAFMIQILNWVGQDYFSPQAVSFLLALGVLALLLKSNESRAAVWISILLFAAITMTHQLTPYWLCGVALLAGIFKRVRPRWIGLVYLAIAVAYAAPQYSFIAHYGLLSGSDPLANAQSNVSTVGSAGRSLTAFTAKIPSLVLWGLALIAGIRGRMRREPVLMPIVLAFSSFGLLGGQSYGGEAIYRVYLYSIPGCALLVAPLLTAVITRRTDPLSPRASLMTRSTQWLMRPVAVTLSLVVLLAGMQAYYGTWFTNVVSQDSLTAEVQLLQTAPTNSMLIPITTGSADRATGNYVAFAEQHLNFDAPLLLMPGVLGESFTVPEVASLTAQLAAYQAPVYLIITQQMITYTDFYGSFPHGALQRLVSNLHASSSWIAVTSTPTVSIFKLVS